MKIKFLLFVLILLSQNFFFIHSNSTENFTFDVTEIEILENGNIVKGLKKGKVKSDNGIIIDSETFFYNKQFNEIKSFGNVKVKDLNKNIDIFSDELIYKKNEELIFTNKNSKATYANKVIFADSFNFDIEKNILSAFGNVKVKDLNKNIDIFSDELIYKKMKNLFSQIKILRRLTLTKSFLLTLLILI